MGGSNSKSDGDEDSSPATLRAGGDGLATFDATGTLGGSTNGTNATTAAMQLRRQQLLLLEDMRAVGLENFGNTCYCNSVIQLLYSCTALRQRALALCDAFEGSGKSSTEETVLSRFCELVSKVHRSKKKKKNATTTNNNNNGSSSSSSPTVVVVANSVVEAPSAFVQRVKKENIMFRNGQQQDAHEFAMFVVNCLIDNERTIMNNTTVAAAAATTSATSSSSAPQSPMPLTKKTSTSLASLSGSTHDTTPMYSSLAAAGLSSSSNGSVSGTATATAAAAARRTPIQDIFEGQFASETSCMDCETRTTRFEPFYDLSVDIEQNASLRQCIENFSAPEFLMGTDKFRCDACCACTPARRCFTIHRAPAQAMLIHLKRFKFHDERQMFKKLSWRVSLPNELAVHTSDEGRIMFTLKGFVLHQGSGPNLGHYICCVRVPETPHLWRKFDDDIVSEVSEREVQQYFGVPFSADNASTSTAYILLYERSVI